jgi:hypothetical protein
MTCARKDCHCIETEIEIGGQRYCCEKCVVAEIAAGAPVPGCACGHPDCKAV